MTSGERALDGEAQLVDALDRSYRYLRRRDRTVAEVRRHLETKRVEPAAIDAAVAELRRQGYLDDARYAQRFTEDRRALDSWGADRIARKLHQVGVAGEHVEAALADRAPEGEAEAALTVLRRRFPAGLPDDRSREKALAQLVRKGYELDLAYDIVRRHERLMDPEHA